jgi:hypothetical protein
MAIQIRVRDYNTVMQHYFDKQKESGLTQCPALLHFLSFLDPRDHFGFLVMCQALPNAEVVCIPRATTLSRVGFWNSFRMGAWGMLPAGKRAPSLAYRLARLHSNSPPILAKRIMGGNPSRLVYRTGPLFTADYVLPLHHFKWDDEKVAIHQTKWVFREVEKKVVTTNPQSNSPNGPEIRLQSLPLELFVVSGVTVRPEDNNRQGCPAVERRKLPS